MSTVDRLLELIMKEYDSNCFKNEVARKLVYDLMSNNLKGMSKDKVLEIAKKWFPKEFNARS